MKYTIYQKNHEDNWEPTEKSWDEIPTGEELVRASRNLVLQTVQENKAASGRNPEESLPLAYQLIENRDDNDSRWHPATRAWLPLDAIQDETPDFSLPRQDVKKTVLAVIGETEEYNIGTSRNVRYPAELLGVVDDEDHSQNADYLVSVARKAAKGKEFDDNDRISVFRLELGPLERINPDDLSIENRLTGESEEIENPYRAARGRELVSGPAKAFSGEKQYQTIRLQLQNGYENRPVTIAQWDVENPEELEKKRSEIERAEQDLAEEYGAATDVRFYLKSTTFDPANQEISFSKPVQNGNIYEKEPVYHATLLHDRTARDLLQSKRRSKSLEDFLTEQQGRDRETGKDLDLKSAIKKGAQNHEQKTQSEPLEAPGRNKADRSGKGPELG